MWVKTGGRAEDRVKGGGDREKEKGRQKKNFMIHRRNWEGIVE